MKPKTPFLPRSPLLAKLDAAVAAAGDPIDIACAQAERAVLLARHGLARQARSEIDALQVVSRRSGSLRLAAWLHLADGLADYFENLAPDARGKIDRSYRDSAAARVPRLHALAAAWLAHLDSANLDFDAMARHASQALHLAAADDHATRARACLVVADALYFAASFESAQPWYRAARRHAMALGDETTLSALMHNMAQFAGHRAREAALFGSHDAARARQALLAAESSLNFDHGVGAASLSALVPVLRAQLFVLLERHREALDLFAANLPQALAEGQHPIEAAFRSDMAWSQARLGARDAAREEAAAAELALDERCPIDECALSHRRLAQVYAELGEPERAATHDQRAAAAMAEYAAMRRRIVAALDRTLQGLKP